MNEQKDQFFGTGPTNNRTQTIQGVLTSRIESRQDKITKQSYYYGFFKLPDQEQEIPVIFKDQADYYKPNLTKGQQVELTGTWSSGEVRPSFTCFRYEILKEPSESLIFLDEFEKSKSLNIYQKLAQVQAKTGQITKAEENKFGKYKYFTEQQALNILKPLLSEQKLTLTFSDENDRYFGSRKKDGEKEWVVEYLKRASLTNSENPTEQLTFNFWAIGSNSDPAKAKGCAETYAIKYFLTKFFLIPTTDELDPDVTKDTEHLNRLKNGKQETAEQIQARHQEKDRKFIAELKAKYGPDWKLSQEYKLWRGSL